MAAFGNPIAAAVPAAILAMACLRVIFTAKVFLSIYIHW